MYSKDFLCSDNLAQIGFEIRFHYKSSKEYITYGETLIQNPQFNDIDYE